MRFSVILALIATTSAIQLNSGSFEEPKSASHTTVNTAQQLNATRIKELTKKNIEEDEAKHPAGLNQTRIDMLAAEKLKGIKIEMDHKKVQKDASKMKNAMDVKYVKDEKAKKVKDAEDHLTAEADYATVDNKYPRTHLQQPTLQMSRTTKD